MADQWLVEEGIGEHRAALLRDGEIVAARIAWLNDQGARELCAGTVTDGVLIARSAGASRGTVRLADGEEVLASRIPKSASEGAPIRVEITRAAIAEPGRTKRAQGRVNDAATRPAPTLAQELNAKIVHRIPEGDWAALIEEAQQRRVDFAGGSLHVSPTPAMTLIDVDGTLTPRALSLAAVPAIGNLLQRFDVGGNIGIDFPTLETKDDRRAVDAAMEDALAGWSHERTAMNGFGFVQIAARMTGPSILHRAIADPAGMAARLLLRRAEMIAQPGAIELRVGSAVKARLGQGWLNELARRTGRELRIVEEAGLAPAASMAQAVPL